jgi:hypothetical protein
MTERNIYEDGAIDWGDPKQVPDMVSYVVFHDVGNLAEFLDDGEYQSACCAALDAMPGGKSAVREAVERVARQWSMVNDWSEFTTDPDTGRTVCDQGGDACS